MISRSLSFLCLLLISATQGLADDLSGTWRCEYATDEYTGTAQMTFQEDETLSARLEWRTFGTRQNRLEFSIEMLWRYSYENGLLTTVPLTAEKARVFANWDSLPEIAEEVRTAMLAPDDAPDVVEFQSKNRMTLTDSDGVTQCRRATRCSILTTCPKSD